MAKKRANGEGTAIHKLKDGRWRALITINGERVPVYGRSQEECKRKRDELQEQARKGIYIKDTKQTFEEWITFWLDEIIKPQVVSGDLKPGTYDYYEYLVRIHIKPGLGKIQLNKITTETLDQFYNKKRQEKKQRGGEGVLSKKIVGDIRKIVGMALNKAVAKRKIQFNPNDYTEPIGKDNPEIEYLTPEEVTEFLDKVSNDYWYPAFVTALGTGLRVGELAALQRNDFNLDEGFVKVQRTATRINTHETAGPKTRLIIQTPKTKKSVRKVPLPVDVVNVIKDLFKQQDELRGNVVELHKDYFVFCWPNNQMVDPNYFTKHFKKLVSKIFKSKDVHFHSLRHSYASMLLANGEDIKVISENLGHTDIKITLDLYTHVMDELKKRSARKLDGFTTKKKVSAKG
ncbi:MAG: tyrosine-type recombinase/integrase [Bacteroidota bacterium]